MTKTDNLAIRRTLVLDDMLGVNKEVISEFRANAGSVTHAVGGALAGVELVLLHHVGRISGRAYVTPVWCMAQDGYFLALGYPTGTAAEPQWVGNLEQATAITVELPDRTETMTPEVLRSGAERDRLYEIVVEQWPFVLDEQHTSRPVPVVRLTPRG